MTNADEKRLAYEAGRTAYSTEPVERRHPEACPFPVGDEQRVEWLRGFSDAFDEEPDRADVRRRLAAHRKEAEA